MRKDLKPCPFCGNTFLGCRIRVNPDEYLHKYEAFIFCHMCGAEGTKAKFAHEMPEEMQIDFAADCWNDRHIDEPEQNCNDCGNINSCGIAPNYGEQVRYNCHLWKPKEKTKGEGKGWTVTERRGEE